MIICTFVIKNHNNVTTLQEAQINIIQKFKMKKLSLYFIQYFFK